MNLQKDELLEEAEPIINEWWMTCNSSSIEPVSPEGFKILVNQIDKRFQPLPVDPELLSTLKWTYPIKQRIRCFIRRLKQIPRKTSRFRQTRKAAKFWKKLNRFEHFLQKNGYPCPNCTTWTHPQNYIQMPLCLECNSHNPY